MIPPILKLDKVENGYLFGNGDVVVDEDPRGEIETLAEAMQSVAPGYAAQWFDVAAIGGHDLAKLTEIPPGLVH